MKYRYETVLSYTESGEGFKERISTMADKTINKYISEGWEYVEGIGLSDHRILFVFRRQDKS